MLLIVVDNTIDGRKMVRLNNMGAPHMHTTPPNVRKLIDRPRLALVVNKPSRNDKKRKAKMQRAVLKKWGKI